jgi:hypothetical protein
MERTNVEKIWWKKIGGGTLNLLGSVIKPGDKFKAYPYQIPKSFRDVIVPLESIKEGVTPVVEPAPIEYKVQPRGKSKTFFDVVDGNGKVVNEKALSKAIAEKLIEDLAK